MPPRDSIHNIVKQAIVKDGWQITDDPYVISYGERFLFVDLAATESSRLDRITGRFIGAEYQNSRIAIEIKEFRGPISDRQFRASNWTIYCLSAITEASRSRAPGLLSHS